MMQRRFAAPWKWSLALGVLLGLGLAPAGAGKFYHLNPPTCHTFGVYGWYRCPTATPAPPCYVPVPALCSSPQKTGYFTPGCLSVGYPAYFNLYFGNGSPGYAENAGTNGSSTGGTESDPSGAGPPSDGNGGSGTPVPSDVAEVDLLVPADAELWIQGIKMTQAGSLRHFVTPLLDASRSSVYEIRAVYCENGQSLTTVRALSVRAGDRLRVNLFVLPAASFSSSSFTKP